MAKKQLDKTPDNYASWTSFHGLKDTEKTKDDFDVMKQVRDDFNSARLARQNNCYWAATAEQNNGSTSAGSTISSNWEDRWEIQMKRWLGWYRPSSSDDLRANLKSPMTAGRIESVLQKFQQLNIGWDALPNNKEDEKAAQCMAIILGYLFEKANFKNAITAWVKDTLIHGTGFARVYYLEKKRKVSFYKDNMSDEDVKKKDLWSKPEDIVVYDDVVVEPKSIWDIYVDPQARCLHGDAYEARYIVERQFMQLDDFKAAYGTNPLANNVDLVKPASKYMDNNKYNFYEPPKDLKGKDAVEVLIYENQLNDQYRVIANDITIINCPLPYDHKEISYHDLRCIPAPHQFYGVGIADRLMNLQGHEEVLMSMAIDKVMQSLQTRFIADASSYGELSKAFQRSDSQIIPIDLSDGKPISQKIMPYESGQIGFDFFKMFEIMEHNATLYTQIDPSQMSLLEGGKTATATMVHKEQIELGIYSLVDNFSHGGLLSMGRQVGSIVRQKYSKARVQKIKGEDKTTYRTLRLKGQEVVENEKGMSLQESNDEYTYFEVKGEYLSTTDDIDVQIKPDTLEIMSRGLQMQKFSEFLGQALQFAADPDNADQMAANPFAVFNLRKISQEWIKTYRLDSDLLIYKEEDEEEALKLASMHVQYIVNMGEELHGEPGKRGPIHIGYEYDTLRDLQTELVNIIDSEKQKTEMMPPQVDPMTGQPIPPQISPGLQKEVQRRQDAIDRLTRHLIEEMMPEQSKPQNIMAGMSGGEMGPAQAPQDMPQQGMPPTQPPPQQPMGPTTQDIMGQQMGGMQDPYAQTAMM